MTPADELNLSSQRAREARLGKRIGKLGYGLLMFSAVVTAAVAGWGVWQEINQAYILFTVAVLFFMLAIWWHWQLSVVPPTGRLLNQRLSKEVLASLPSKSTKVNPRFLWKKLKNHWQPIFMTNHLWLDPKVVQKQLSEEPKDLMFVWDKASELADQAGSQTIEPGHLAASLILTSQDMNSMLSQAKLSPDDVMDVTAWLDRILKASQGKKQNYGGIGRDWANGFTPNLNQFGQNISSIVEHFGGQASSLTGSPGVNQIKQVFSQGAGAVALIGEDGIGKTSHVWALAQNVLAETQEKSLTHNQIYALSPSPIISAARHQGDLEHIINTLMIEASHAGHVLLFFDDAELFFSRGTGSLDATKVLLPALESRAVRFIFALNPADWQRLKQTNPSFAGQLTPVVLQEPKQDEVMRSLEDAATRFEVKRKVTITLEALKEAYRLSGRYEQDMAYPGKAIRLLEQALTHQENKLVSAASVQSAIEQTTGVKASSTTPAESSQLLQLEDQIHQRMINQSHAVSVVANALRRARAGVANPKRPIGSFLFLGPTGVGKTELARSIAATYFGDETSMIRLDMSEYQQESDVSRLLASGQNESSSLILKVRQQPFAVVLLDEVEKAHHNILNLLLQMLDEGALTDDAGRPVSFKDCVIICTSNAGADTIRSKIEQGEELANFEKQLTDQLINGNQFKPELINRFDEVVLFRPLKPEELAQVVGLMLAEVNQNLANQNINVSLTAAAVDAIVEQGNDPRLGARPMRRAVQRTVEDHVAQKILRGEVHPGDAITLDVSDITSS